MSWRERWLDFDFRPDAQKERDVGKKKNKDRDHDEGTEAPADPREGPCLLCGDLETLPILAAGGGLVWSVSICSLCTREAAKQWVVATARGLLRWQLSERKLNVTMDVKI